jgi:spore coat protein U-like protein
MTPIRMLLVCVLAVVLAGVAPRALAADTCTVTSTGVNFGTYDPTSATPLNAQGSLTVECSAGSSTTVAMTLSAGGSNSFASRRMSSGTDFMFYNLYLNTGRTIIFGDGSGGSSSDTCTTGAPTSGNGCTGDNPPGRGRLFVRPIYGQVNASQNVSVGTYTDTIFYTITF